MNYFNNKKTNTYDFSYCKVKLRIPLMDCRLGRMVTAPSAISSWFRIGVILDPQLSEPTQMKWPV